jgi:Predicted hydrolase of the alpha/beta-hydrolase fold
VPARPTVLLGPGASGGIERLGPYIAGLERRGIAGRAVALPRGKTDPALATYRAALAQLDSVRTIIGGHSFGGRMASLLAAEVDVAGLVLFAYPLHPPGKRHLWDERTAHWPAITCPVLLLSGESDPFAEIGLLRKAALRLPRAELVSYPRVRHGIGPVLDDALDRVASFVAARITE